MVVFESHASIGNNSLVVRHGAQKSESYDEQTLRISFMRTIRVPDNAEESALPPGLSAFPLFKVRDFATTCPEGMVATGGAFFPMYQREAMWINFTSNNGPFMVKIFAGTINAISGEPREETMESKMRRLTLASNGQSIQDYVVTGKYPDSNPGQWWLDGFAVAPGTVRQFIAMPIGSGYSVEAQLTGQEAGGLRFEITPFQPQKFLTKQSITRDPATLDPCCTSDCPLAVKTLTGKTIRPPISLDASVLDVKESIQRAEGIPPDQMRLVFAGRQLENKRALDDYGIGMGCTLHLILRLRGGGQKTISLAAGGNIKQEIVEDTCDPELWIKDSTVSINVHILNSAAFREVTGRDPPPCPVSASTYAEAGLPFFDLPEEPSGISGCFSKVKSVNSLDVDRGTTSGPEPMVSPRVVKIVRQNDDGTKNQPASSNKVTDPDGLVDCRGPLGEFRTLKDLEAEVKRLQEDDWIEVS